FTKCPASPSILTEEQVVVLVILETRGVCKRFGGLQAVKNVSLQVEQGSIHGLIGPNGAGKTTFLNCIAGVYRPEEGKVFFKGQDITGLSADKICHAGIARTFQIVHSFPQMTVLENVMIGAIFGGKKDGVSPKKKAAEMLDFVEFSLSHNVLAQNLNTIQLKRLEMARALSTGCDLLLLDEVASGLTPAELDDMSNLIKRIRDKGITIIMVEHLMKLIMGVCDRITVFYFGEKIAEGTPDEIVQNEKVVEAYLGAATKL
ncbi:MAG: ABC transporter ATP-binding protein, partial [Desulfofundulus sp.]